MKDNENKAAGKTAAELIDGLIEKSKDADEVAALKAVKDANARELSELENEAKQTKDKYTTTLEAYKELLLNGVAGTQPTTDAAPSTGDALADFYEKWRAKQNKKAD